MGLASFNMMYEEQERLRQQALESELHQEENPAKDLSKSSVEQLKAALNEREIKFPSTAKKADLIALLQGGGTTAQQSDE